MPSGFPITLDNFPNPSGSTGLDATGPLKHHAQHENVNDAVEAMQTRVGVTGSGVPSTVDYELHSVDHGHNHDGINSRTIADLPLAILLADSGPFEYYVSGSFHETTYVGRVFPATSTWYHDSSKTKTIIEQIITYNTNRTPNTIVWNIFEKDGVTIRTKATDTITYVSGLVVESSRTRIISSSL